MHEVFHNVSDFISLQVMHGFVRRFSHTSITIKEVGP